ncbi:MAG: hypothetical protein LBF84_03640 [Holosporales bacterium]|nr:hypothetical protein [Holosporales bacterium]
MMTKFSNKYLLAAGLTVLLAGCAPQRIDFENDVPQRARSISQQHVKNAREAMEVPALRAQYREYVNEKKGNSGKTLSRLQQEKKALERKISVIVRSNGGNVCPICRKKFNVRPTKRSLIEKSAKRRAARKPATGRTTTVAQQPPHVATMPAGTMVQQAPTQGGFYDPYAQQQQLQQPQLPQQQGGFSMQAPTGTMPGPEQQMQSQMPMQMPQQMQMPMQMPSF